MLTETQIDIIGMLSWAVWFGLLGGFCGLLTGALVFAIRTHHVSSFMLGILRGVLPSLSISVAVSLFVALIQIELCKPGLKEGWDVPVWSLSVQAIAIFTAGTMGSLIAPRLLPKMLGFKMAFGLAFIGAVLGAIANLDTAFDGYYVLESNARPVHQAITGFVTGVIVVLLWRFVVEMLQINKVLKND